MTGTVKAIPEGYHTVTPYLILSDAGDAIAFYKEALGAEEVMRLGDPGGKVHHAEIRIGDSPHYAGRRAPRDSGIEPKDRRRFAGLDPSLRRGR